MATRIHDAMILGSYDPTATDAFLAALAAEEAAEDSGDPVVAEEDPDVLVPHAVVNPELMYPYPYSDSTGLPVPVVQPYPSTGSTGLPTPLVQPYPDADTSDGSRPSAT
jgi:hypothetical protein